MTSSLRNVFYKADSPRDDAVITLFLIVLVVVAAIMPYLIYRGPTLPGNMVFLEELDLILGPIVIAGGVGLSLEDYFEHRRKMTITHEIKEVKEA
jgi:NhaP-type Na+/H+ or K+/H+ antiporter